MSAEFSVLLVSLVLVSLAPFLRQVFIPKSGVEAAAKPATTIRPARSGFFDMLRGVAILGVVVIHITYLITPYAGALALPNDLINNLLRFALPVFFVSSGVLLLVPKLHVRWLASFYSRRFIALGIPYLLVTLALGLYHDASTSEIWYNIFTGDAAVPLYFVPVMFQLYLLYPFIHNLSQRQWFVWVTLVLSITSYLVPSLRFWQDLSYATPYIFFFVWGIYMRHLFQQAQPKVSPAPWLMMVIMFVALQFYFGVDRFYNGQYFYGIAIIMLLLWLYTTKRIPAMINTYSEFIGQRSLWIFLTHFTWLQGLLHFLLAQSVTLTIVSTVIFIVCGLVGSAVLGICFHYLQSYITSHIMRYRN